MVSKSKKKPPERIDKKKFLLNALLAVASAILFWLSFPPVDFAWAAWVALIPWLILIRRTSPKKALLWSALAGAVAFVALLHWIRFVSYAGWISLALYCAAYWPAAGLLFNWLRRRGIAFTWSAPLIIVTMDFVRGRFLTGFPFFFLGHSQHAVLPVIQIADITGVFGVTFAIAIVNGFLTERVFDRFKSGKKLWMELVATVCVLASVFGYGVYRLQTIETSPGPQVALVQGNIPTDLKHSPSREELLETLQDHVTLTREAAAPGTDLVIWAETMVPVPLNQALNPAWIQQLLESEDESHVKYGEFLANCAAEVKEALTEANSSMLIGAETMGTERYNSAYLLTPDGAIAGRYDKLHLVVFGEYTPLVRIFPFLKIFRPPVMGPDISPGRFAMIFGLPIRDGDPVRFGTTICYEDAEPRVFRRFVKHGAAFMVNMTNDGWFKDSSELDHHLHICAFRAVENRVPIARCANTGISALIEPTGRIAEYITDADGNRRTVRGTLTGRLALTSARAYYTRIGDLFAWLCLLALGVLAFYAKLRKNTGRSL